MNKYSFKHYKLQNYNFQFLESKIQVTFFSKINYQTKTKPIKNNANSPNSTFSTVTVFLIDVSFMISIPNQTIEIIWKFTAGLQNVKW